MASSLDYEQLGAPFPPFPFLSVAFGEKNFFLFPDVLKG